jgi:hypothetical protein
VEEVEEVKWRSVEVEKLSGKVSGKVGEFEGW